MGNDEFEWGTSPDIKKHIENALYLENKIAELTSIKEEPIPEAPFVFIEEDEMKI